MFLYYLRGENRNPEIDNSLSGNIVSDDV